MTETTNRRPDKRFPTHLETFYYARRVDAVGVVANISYSGALVEDTTIQPEIGTPVTLYVYLQPPSAFAAEAPFELAGHVVRHSSNGFAIEYKDNLDPDVRRMVDDTAAVVAAPR
jgi:hypothetical protein